MHSQTVYDKIRAKKTVNKEGRSEEKRKWMEVHDVTEATASSELGLQVAESMKNTQEVIYLICYFQNGNFQELRDEQELTLWESLLDPLDLILIDLPVQYPKQSREHQFSS